jgi:glutamate synthase (NADPH/NADH) small chain
MGDIKGFQKYGRSTPESLSVEERVSNFKEFYVEKSEDHKIEQAARCMDCGIPFCHNGCPLGNVIPDFNHAVFQGEWKKAYEILISTNNFPEFTGRICPAPCEGSCVLSINNDAVAIEYIEKSIIERAFIEGWVEENKVDNSSGKKVAVIGSGPAGLACADELNKCGHEVTVFEREDKIGGLLRYGIPDFKMEKNVIDRRIDIMKKSGIQFRMNTNIGVDISSVTLKKDFDCIVLCTGSTVARELPIEGRELKGVHLAMEYLTQNNKRVAGNPPSQEELIDVEGKDVLVIGGGDTGSDCIGTSHRLGAKHVMQIELMSKPPSFRSEQNPWPNWPQIIRTSSSQEEGCEREWSILTKRFVSNDGTNLSGIETVKIEWKKNDQGKYLMQEIPNSKEIIPCQKVFLAIGFLHTEKRGLLEHLDIAFDESGNVQTDNFQTNISGVFSSGDMRRGQSLVVWAIAEGRDCAVAVHEYLTSDKTKKLISMDNAYAL